MSVTTCALSGQPLINPVVSTKTGHVFERDLIQKHLAATGQCPITGVNLDAESDLVELQVAKAAAPKPLVANNIPSILQLLQGEWDSTMLEVFTLRKNLDETRKELSHALYQHDAACQVICRLISEKEELQNQLNSSESKFEDLKESLARQPAVTSNEVQEQSQKQDEDHQVEEQFEGISAELQERMEKLSDNLIEKRKKQKAPSDYPKRDELAKFKESGSYPLHKSTAPGIVNMDVLGDQYVITGGKDGQAVLFDAESEQIVTKFSPYGEANPLTLTSFLPGQAPEQQGSLVMLGTSHKNGQLGLWNIQEQKSLYEVKCHSATISDISFQALNEFVAVGSRDGSWSFHNILEGKKLGQWKEESPVSSIKFHPDGLVLAVGLASGVIKVYDIRDQKVAMQLAGEFPQTDANTSSEVTNITFSNKGLYMAATFANQDICRVYSLHKQCAFTDISHGGNPINSIAFDVYGGYLATSAGKHVGLYHYRNWGETRSGEYSVNGPVSVVKFGAQCKKLFLASQNDANLSVYTL